MKMFCCTMDFIFKYRYAQYMLSCVSEISLSVCQFSDILEKKLDVKLITHGIDAKKECRDEIPVSATLLAADK